MPKTTANAIRILHRRHYQGKIKRQRALEKARTSAKIARKIYQLRNEAELSQRELATLVGTTASVICRLEDDDYTGHSLTMLHRIAHALDQRIEIHFVPLAKKSV